MGKIAMHLETGQKYSMRNRNEDLDHIESVVTFVDYTSHAAYVIVATEANEKIRCLRDHLFELEQEVERSKV